MADMPLIEWVCPECGATWSLMPNCTIKRHPRSMSTFGPACPGEPVLRDQRETTTWKK